MALSFNTKQDYLTYLTVNPVETKKALQILLDTRFIWQTTAILAANAAGVSDSTHRVIGEEPERMQQEWVEDPNAQIFRLGFTVTEVEGLIENA